MRAHLLPLQSYNLQRRLSALDQLANTGRIAHTDGEDDDNDVALQVLRAHSSVSSCISIAQGGLSSSISSSDALSADTTLCFKFPTSAY